VGVRKYMQSDSLDFEKIYKALQDTYDELDIEELETAHESYMDALSYATSVDKQYLKYRST
jgi:hypothetical protein